MRRVGKKTKQWLAFRKQWLKDNPPNHEGYYVCYYCGRWMLPEEMTLDHKQSRSRYPELRLELSNIVPCCLKDNQQKGSRSIEEYLRM